MAIPGCSAEIVAGSVDGTVRRFDVRAGLETADDLGGVCVPPCSMHVVAYPATAASAEHLQALTSAASRLL